MFILCHNSLWFVCCPAWNRIGLFIPPWECTSELSTARATGVLNDALYPKNLVLNTNLSIQHAHKNAPQSITVQYSNYCTSIIKEFLQLNLARFYIVCTNLWKIFTLLNCNGAKLANFEDYGTCSGRGIFCGHSVYQCTSVNDWLVGNVLLVAKFRKTFECVQELLNIFLIITKNIFKYSKCTTMHYWLLTCIHYEQQQPSRFTGWSMCHMHRAVSNWSLNKHKMWIGPELYTEMKSCQTVVNFLIALIAAIFKILCWSHVNAHCKI